MAYKWWNDVASERRHVYWEVYVWRFKKECGGHIFCFVWLKSQVLILAFIVGRFSSLHPWESSIISNWLSVISDSLWLHGLQPARLLCPWNSPGKNTGVGCHFLLEVIFPTQGSNPDLLPLQADSLPTEPPGKPKNTGMDSLSLLQEIFLTQECNQDLSCIADGFFTSWAM